jgi:protein gp37
MIFAIDMGDIFGPCIPFQWVDNLMYIINECPQLFQILTKFPGRLLQWARAYGLPQNVWAGVTVCTQSMVEPALKCLSHIDAAVTYLCVEPLQERIVLNLSGIDWIIIGARTDPLIVPEPRWVEELLQEASRCETQVFLKKSLGWHKKVNNWPEVTGEKKVVTRAKESSSTRVEVHRLLPWRKEHTHSCTLTRCLK